MGEQDPRRGPSSELMPTCHGLEGLAIRNSGFLEFGGVKDLKPWLAPDFPLNLPQSWGLRSLNLGFSGSLPCPVWSWHFTFCSGLPLFTAHRNPGC